MPFVQTKTEDITADQLRPGDIVYRAVQGLEIFRHYGCYAGRDYLGRHWFFEHCKGSNSRLVEFDVFAKGYQVKYKRIPEGDRFAAVSRMRNLLSNPREYDEINFNCEHAANHIASGRSESGQVAISILLVLGLGLYVLGRK